MPLYQSYGQDFPQYSIQTYQPPRNTLIPIDSPGRESCLFRGCAHFPIRKEMRGLFGARDDEVDHQRLTIVTRDWLTIGRLKSQSSTSGSLDDVLSELYTIVASGSL